MPLVSIDLQVIPWINSEGVSSLISDSINMYNLNTNVWQMFSNNAEEYWYFPEGIHVEQFDSLFQIEGDIVADTAYYFTDKELWHAIGNVVVKNSLGRIFKTSELFWDLKVPPNTMNAFYTNRPVRIIEPDSTYIDGNEGFTADRSLIKSFFYKTKGEFIIEESPDTSQQGIISSDSIQLQ